MGFGNGGGVGAGGGASSDLLRLLQQAGAAGGLGVKGMNPGAASGGPPAPQLSLQDQLRGLQ